MTRIAIILGSTRPGRNGEAVARWVVDIASRRSDAAYELVDIADDHLPHLDEAAPPSMGLDTQPHTKAWAETLASFDGYVFVTPEYNHSTSGALKNAIDFLYAEWNNKAAGFVSYGSAGGTRAVEHLRLVMAELQVADVRAQVALSLFTDFTNSPSSPPPRTNATPPASCSTRSWPGAPHWPACIPAERARIHPRHDRDDGGRVEQPDRRRSPPP